MSGVYITGMEMPKDGFLTITVTSDGRVVGNSKKESGKFEYLDNEDIAKAVPVPDHGRLIDADVLRAKMYHEAFETDTPMQKWDSGCWIRYKMFERMEEAAPTIIPADHIGDATEMVADKEEEG